MPNAQPTKPLPSVEHLRACLDYDPGTGVLTWKRRPREHFATHKGWAMRNAKFADKVAGTVHRLGYRYVSIDDREYTAHRLIWKWMTGDEPLRTIDHTDNDKDNNAWVNLRMATQMEQCWNRSPNKINRSGHKGVYQKGVKWRAEIATNGVRKILGVFGTAAEASAAYESAARELHGKFYRQPGEK
jgi:hypothetical protein